MNERSIKGCQIVLDNTAMFLRSVANLVYASKTWQNRKLRIIGG